MRVDTTVVETNIHYPTDSTLLAEGVRVLTRTMKKITKIAGAVGTKLCDRSASLRGSRIMSQRQAQAGRSGGTVLARWQEARQMLEVPLCFAVGGGGGKPVRTGIGAAP
jgi:hypothetical protein